MNSGDFNSFLNGVMSDPDMMNKIKAISESIGGGGEPAGFEDKSGDTRSDDTAIAEVDSKAKNRAALIRALMPYLSDVRRDKAEMLLKLVSLAELRHMI